MGEHTDEELVSRALDRALLRRDPPAEMRVHSDQGSLSTSHGSHGKLLEGGIVVSMRRTGDGSDNAAMERFFSTLKGECVDRTRFTTRLEARHTIFA
jgi:transposase InsO family protein